MRKIAVFVILILAMSTVALAAGYKNLQSREAKGVIEKTPAIFLLDVRTPDEFKQARLKGAVLIPMSEIERRITEIPKNRPIVVYCAVGSRSAQVAGLLSRKGYGEVYNMSDGIVGWYRNGYPIVR